MSLPEIKQDASLANTYEARPGVSSVAPAGPTATDNEELSSSVKGSLDNIAEPKSATQAISEQLPTAQGTAEAVRTGANSLIAGISNLAFGAKDTVAQNAAESHPESDNATKVDDLHIPGAFEDETDDAEDIAAVKQGFQSAAGTLPSTQDVKNSLPSVEAISKQIPSVPLGSRTNQQSSSGSVQQGQDVRDGTGNINSVGVNSTASRPVGQVPMESRGVPQVVSDSQRLAGASPGASSVTESVLEKKQLERELKREVPVAAVSSAGSTGTPPSHTGGVPQVVSDSQRQAGISPEAASNPAAVEEKMMLEQELKREITPSTAGSTGFAGASVGLDRGVPQVVADSQKKADASPEASANAEAVREKKEVERELRREVPQHDNTDNTPVNLGEAVSGGLVSAGAAIAGAATYARQKTHEATGTDPVAVLPESAQHAIDGQVTSPSTTRSAQPTTGTQQSTSQNITDTLAGGMAAAGSAAANAATYARQKTHEATGTDPVAILPESAQKSIDGEVIAPNTTRSTTVGDRGSQSVADTISSGASAAGSAATSAAVYARQKTHEATGTDPVAILPESAQKSIDGEVIAPNTTRSTTVGDRGSQSVADTISSGASAAGSAATSAAVYARQKTHEATGTDPVAILPESAQKSIDGEVIAPNTTRSTTVGDRGSQSVADTISSGASAAGSAATSAAVYARQKTHETTGTDPVAVLPTSVQKNIDGQNSSYTGGNLSHSSESAFSREPVAGSHTHGVDLHSGVHNGVVGDHLDDDSKASHRTPSGSHSGHWQPGSSATVAHIPSLRDVDLSAGVKNTVVGSGADTAEADDNTTTAISEQQ